MKFSDRQESLARLKSVGGRRIPVRDARGVAGRAIRAALSDLDLVRMHIGGAGRRPRRRRAGVRKEDPAARALRHRRDAAVARKHLVVAPAVRGPDNRRVAGERLVDEVVAVAGGVERERVARVEVALPALEDEDLERVVLRVHGDAAEGHVRGVVVVPVEVGQDVGQALADVDVPVRPAVGGVAGDRVAAGVDAHVLREVVA